MKRKGLLIVSIVPLITSLIGCNQNKVKPVDEDDDFVIEGETPTPSGTVYSFNDVDERDEKNKIQIDSLNGLIEFREKVNQKDAGYVDSYVELTTDIVLKDNWIPIEGFKGQFNGNGHKISGLTIETSQIRQGLFSYIDGAKIGCLTIEGNIKAGDNSAFVSGYTIGDCTMVGITVEGKLNSTSNVGGLVGIVSSGSLKVVGCINKAIIKGTGFVGGLVGINNTYKINVSDSANYGLVVGKGAYVGGIIAMLTNSTSIKNDYNLYRCFNYGVIKGKSYIGGACGFSSAPLISCGVGTKGQSYRVLDDDTLEEAKVLLSFAAPFCSTLCGSIIRNVSNNALGELIECENAAGFAITGINDPAGCTRVIKYKDKIMLFAATNKYAISEDGGHTFGEFTTVSDKTTEKCPIDGENSTDTGNTQPFVLEDGRIVMMYRAIRKASSFSYSSLRMRLSDTNGVFNKNDEPITLIENYTSNTGTAGAFYEPYPILLEDGTIATYISEDVHYSEEYNKDGLHIDKLKEELICPGGSQDTVLIPIKIAPNATEVGEGKIEILEPQLIFKGSNTDMFGHANSRPGMTVLTRLYDGSWAMTLENSTEQHNPGYNLVVQITYSRDGLTWTAPRTIIRPNQPGGTSNADNKLFKTCAPFCATLPDGRLVITCATDEAYEGYFPTDDAHYKHEIAFITKNRIGYNDTFTRDDLIQVRNYDYNPNEYCVWASVAVVDGRVYVSGLEGVNGLKDDGTVSSPTQWILLSTIHYQNLYDKLGISELR